MRKFWITAVTFSSLFWVGCSKPPLSADARAKACLEKLEKSRALMAKNKFSAAREPLQELTEQCQGSGLTEEAQFLLAEAEFGLEDWIAARAEYSLFLDQYPRAEQAPLASFRKALSASNLPHKEGRDGSSTQEALTDLGLYLRKYPEHPYADSARSLQQSLMERLARDSYHVGRLYLRMGEPQAAALALKDFLEVYPQSTLVPQVYMDLVDAYRRLDQFGQARSFIEQYAAHPKADAQKVSSLKTNVDASELKFQNRIKAEEAKRIQKEKES
jgi:outer membrane protein assembly factor BamD